MEPWVTLAAVHPTAKVKLLTDDAQFRALKHTLESANAACDWISEEAWKAKQLTTFAIHALTYHTARKRFGLSAQIAARCTSKVAAAYKLDHRSTSRRPATSKSRPRLK
jgi:putative transposase